MNIAIVGSSGYIAGYLINRFSKETSIERIVKIGQTSDADEFLELTEPEKFNYDSLDSIDYIVFTAAISGPDKCAQDFDFCWSINVTGTSFFIAEAIKRGCRVLFFSSDAVFGDDKGFVFNENSSTQAKTPYGRMKKEIEDRFKDSIYFKAIRLSYVVSTNDRFVSYCLNCIEKNETADVFHPFYRNCITVTDVENTILWLLCNWEKFPHSFLNVAGRELVSRIRIADEINRIKNNSLTYSVSTPGADFYLNRPKITQMESLFLYKENIVEDRSFSEKMNIVFSVR